MSSRNTAAEDDLGVDLDIEVIGIRERSPRRQERLVLVPDKKALKAKDANPWEVEAWEDEDGELQTKINKLLKWEVRPGILVHQVIEPKPAQSKSG